MKAWFRSYRFSESAGRFIYNKKFSVAGMIVMTAGAVLLVMSIVSGIRSAGGQFFIVWPVAVFVIFIGAFLSVDTMLMIDRAAGKYWFGKSMLGMAVSTTEGELAEITLLRVVYKEFEYGNGRDYRYTFIFMTRDHGNIEFILYGISEADARSITEQLSELGKYPVECVGWEY